MRDFQNEMPKQQDQQVNVTNDNDTSTPESHCDIHMNPVMKMVQTRHRVRSQPQEKIKFSYSSAMKIITYFILYYI